MKVRRIVSAAAVMPGIKKAVLLWTAAFFLLVLTALPSFAYETNIYLSSFQNIDWQSKLTGEIYYNWTSGTTSAYSYCVNPAINMPVPGTYYAERFSIAGNENLLKAAWLMDNYAYSKAGFLTGFDALQTGTIVQLAIYSVIGQAVAPPVSGYEALFTQRDALLALIPTTDLAYLSARYAGLDIYQDSSKVLAFQDVLTPVPVPAAMWLFGSGLVALAGLRTRRRQTENGGVKHST